MEILARPSCDSAACSTTPASSPRTHTIAKLLPSSLRHGWCTSLGRRRSFGCCLCLWTRARCCCPGSRTTTVRQPGQPSITVRRSTTGGGRLVATSSHADADADAHGRTRRVLLLRRQRRLAGLVGLPSLPGAHLDHRRGRHRNKSGRCGDARSVRRRPRQDAMCVGIVSIGAVCAIAIAIAIGIGRWRRR